tara:strand:+ start:956 stop:1843 length:888 start_codon:yes stop_codon:yes gene_type:complete
MVNPNQGFNLAGRLQQDRANKENNFYNNLLAYGMTAGGSFSASGDKITYTPSSMPDKTTMWNEFVAMKNGRINQQDIASFEAQWRQANAMKSYSAAKELNKLTNMGYDRDKISDVIAGDETLYNSLLDMVSDLEEQAVSTGDDNAFAQAETLKSYFPEKDKGILRDLGPQGWATLAAGTGLAISNKKGIMDVAKKIKSKASSMTGSKVKGLGTAAPFIAYGLAPELGFQLYGKQGRQVAQTGADLGLLGMAARTLVQGPPLAKVAGAALMGIPAISSLISDYGDSVYDTFFPDEE